MTMPTTCRRHADPALSGWHSRRGAGEWPIRPWFGQRRSATGALNLDADGDGARMATTDGLLLERAALGMIGAPLISNARNTGFPRVRSATLILQWILDTHGANCLP